MISKDDFLEIIETLKKHKSRTLLTAFGVFWGIFMLLLLLGSGDGLEKGVTSMFSGFNLSSFHIYTGITKTPYKGIKENRRIRFTNDDVIALTQNYQSSLTNIAAKSFSYGERLVKNGKIYSHYAIEGVEPEIFKIITVNLIAGRYLNHLDNKGGKATVMIGSKVKDKLFGNQDVIGRFIEIENSFYKIVGVFTSFQEGQEADQENKKLILPHTTFQHNFSRGAAIDQISVVTTTEATESKIIAFLKKRHKVHPNDIAIDAWSTRKEFAKFQGLFAAIRAFMWVIGIGTLLSGIVGVSNIMVISIKERTKEIGIRKAIGATPFSIIKIIVLESVFLTGFSGYLGLSIGLLCIEGLNYMLVALELKSEFFLNPEIDPVVVFVAIVILLCTGFFAAFLPARKAAMIQPIEALKEN